MDAGVPIAPTTQDAGGDMQLRLRYQAAYLAVHCLKLLDDELICVVCEHDDDGLLVTANNRWIYVQVATHVGDPFTAGAEKVVHTLARFSEHEAKNGDKVEKYLFVASNGFAQESKASANLFKLQALAKAENGHDEPPLSTYIKKIAKAAKVDNTVVVAMLRKLHLETKPASLFDGEERFRTAISERPEFKRSLSIEIARFAKDLVAEILSASAKSHGAAVREYFATTADPKMTELSAELVSKTVEKQRLVKLIAQTRVPEALLKTSKHLSVADLPKGTRKMVKKMATGGVSAANVELWGDYKYNAEHLFITWAYKFDPDEADARYQHVRLKVNTQCAEAHDATQKETGLYGTEMLQEVRRRTKELKAVEGASLYDCHYEHLLGVSGVLTEDCKVWWSKPFDLAGDE